MGTGYYILLIISLIFIAYTSTLIGLYASDTITFNPDTSNWIWLSLGVAGMFGCFGMYMVFKSMFSGSETPKEPESIEIVRQTVRQPTNYESIPKKLQQKESQNPPKYSVATEYGFMPSLSESQYDTAPPEVGEEEPQLKRQPNKNKGEIIYDKVLPVNKSQEFNIDDYMNDLPDLSKKNKDEESSVNF